jgi:nucleotide-binding universal stress UspA family protein
MYQKILVPLDGSERAAKILPHVENLAAIHTSQIVLIRVVHTIILDDGYKNIQYQESMAATQKVFQEAENYLEGVAVKLKKKGLSVQHLIQTGPVVKTILDIALKENVDLIAMASHGRSGLGRVFYGSVAAGIIQHIDRPLLIIRSRDVE